MSHMRMLYICAVAHRLPCSDEPRPPQQSRHRCGRCLLSRLSWLGQPETNDGRHTHANCKRDSLTRMGCQTSVWHNVADFTYANVHLVVSVRWKIIHVYTQIYTQMDGEGKRKCENVNLHVGDLGFLPRPLQHCQLRRRSRVPRFRYRMDGSVCAT